MKQIDGFSEQKTYEQKRNSIICFLLSIGSFFYLLSYYKYGLSPTDGHVRLNDAMRILSGQTPLIDFFSYFPGQYTPELLSLLLFGNDLGSLRLFWVVVTAFCIVPLLYIASREVLSVRYSLIVCTLFLLLPGTYFTRLQPLLVCLSLVAVLYAIKNRFSAFWCFLCGLIGGFAFTARLDISVSLAVGLLSAVCAVWFSASPDERRAMKGNYFKGGILFLSTYFGVIALFFLWYKVHGMTPQEIFAPFLAYTGDFSLPYWSLLKTNRYLFFWTSLPLFTYLLMFPLLVWYWNEWKKERVILLFLSLIGLLLYQQMMVRVSNEHVVKQEMPFLILSLFLIHFWWTRQKVAYRVLSLLFTTVLLFWAGSLMFQGGFATGSPTVLLQKNLKPVDALSGILVPEEEEKIVSALIEREKSVRAKGEIFYVIPYFGLYLYHATGTTIPLRIPWILPNMAQNIDQQAILTEMVRKVDEVVYLDVSFDGMASRNLKNFLPYFYGALFTLYEPVKSIGNYLILRNRLKEKKPFQLQNISLHGKTFADFPSNLDILEESPALFTLMGWGYIKGLDPKKSKQTILLKSADATYRFNPVQIGRADVANYFKDASLLYTGFQAYIPKQFLPEGVYRIGLLIEKGGTTKEPSYIRWFDKTLHVKKTDKEIVGLVRKVQEAYLSSADNKKLSGR